MKDLDLKGKYLTRKIDDNTFINFADFILNNIENAEYNIAKIRNSLANFKRWTSCVYKFRKTIYL